eukprot:8451564-Alexandrium_andersonii.AAC.1
MAGHVVALQETHWAQEEGVCGQGSFCSPGSFTLPVGRGRAAARREGSAFSRHHSGGLSPLWST